MSFIDNLRMQGIFTPQNPNGGMLGPPDFGSSGSGNDVNGMLRTIMQLRDAAKNGDLHRQESLMNFKNNLDFQNMQTDRAYNPKPATGINPFADIAQQQYGPKGQLDTAVKWPDDDKRTSEKLTQYQAGMLANDAAKNDIARQSLNERGTNNKAKDENADQDRALKAKTADSTMGIRKENADSRKWLTEHPAAQFLKEEGGNWHVYDRATGAMKDTGVSTGTMTQQQVQDGLQNNRIQLQDMKGDQADEQIDRRNKGNLADIAARSANNLEVAKYRGSNKSTQQSASQQGRDQWNKAQQLINTKPELSQFITLGPNGQFTVQEPSHSYFTGDSGPNPAQLKEINDFIYGTGNSATTTPATTPTTTPATTSNLRKPIPGTDKFAISADGGKTWKAE